MATELGRYFVSISGNTSQLGKDIKRTFGDIDATVSANEAKATTSSQNVVNKSAKAASRAQQAGVQTLSQLATRAGSVLVDKTYNASRAAQQKISTVFKFGALAVGGVIAGALTSGFGRLNAIDTAQTKISSMGLDVKRSMDIANTAVKGTSFALDEAVTTLASFAGAGIGLSDMGKYLSITADAATAAGTQMDEMGHIVSGVMARGRAYTGEFNQIAQRGLSIMPQLQEATGATAEEVMDLFKQGRITADIFIGALGEAYEGAAALGGTTVQGSWSNLRTAITRTSAAVLESSFNRLPDIFSKISETIDTLSPSLVRFGNSIVEAVFPYIEKLVDKFAEFVNSGELNEYLEHLADKFEELIPKLKEIVPPLFAAAKAVGSAAWQIFLSILEILTPILEALVPLFAAMAEGIARNELVAKLLGAALLGFLGAAQAITLVKSIMSFTNGFMQLTKALSVANTTTLWTIGIWGMVVVAVAAVVAALVHFFTKTETGKRVWKSFTEFLDRAWDNFVLGIKDGYETIKNIFGWLKGHLGGFKGFFVGAFNIMKSVGSGALKVIGGTIEWLVIKPIKGLIWALEKVLELISKIGNTPGSILKKVSGGIGLPAAGGFKDGGIVPGVVNARTARADNILTRVSPGEIVFSNRDIDRLGGRDAVESLRTGKGSNGVGNASSGINIGEINAMDVNELVREMEKLLRRQSRRAQRV